jgi:Fe2+ transport system protein FeoA
VNPIALGDLPTGQSAHVRRIVGRPDQVHRFEEFGLCGGAEVRMFRPGDPCIIHLGGHKVCLRADGFVQVLVDPIGN